MQPSCALISLEHQCGPQFRGPGEVCWLTVAWYIAGMTSGNMTEFFRQYRAERRRLGYPTP